MPISRYPDESSQSLEDKAETVAVVITTFNDAAYLAEAIESVLAQARTPDEIIVVDDGSDHDPDPVVRRFPQVTCLRKPNGGLSSARNFGLAQARSRYITFLDADDRYESHALATGLACFAANPQAAAVYGGYRRIDAHGNRIGRDHLSPAGMDPYADLLVSNFIGMHATVLYRRVVLEQLGGFDETLRRSEDYDLYLRLFRRFPVASHGHIIAEYRRHDGNMSSNNAAMLHTTLLVHERHRDQAQAHRRRAWLAGQQQWRTCYRDPTPERFQGGIGRVIERFLQRVKRAVRWRARKYLHGGRIHRLYRRRRGLWPPAFGDVRFGDLASIQPVSRDFGYDRGNPVDRYYIENFLESRKADVQGHVLEVAEDTYSKRFGGSKITRQDVIHLNDPEPPVTIVGDLTKVGTLPDNTFDCIIITQTLQMIFNLQEAVERLHAALKPGGVLLVTVPGISELERGDWNEAWRWAFTPTSVRDLFSKVFPSEAMEIVTHGNCFAAIAFLVGVAVEELDTRKLDSVDVMYPVIVTLRARKA